MKFELLQKVVENQGEETKRQWDAISKQQEIVNKLVIYSLCDQAYNILYGLSIVCPNIIITMMTASEDGCMCS
jgi:hypothetical protein